MSLISSLIPSRRDNMPATCPPADATDLGPTVSPRYRVTETAEAYDLTIDLPGVAKGDLDISVDHEQIRVVGRRAWRQPESWTPLHRETRDAAYELVLDHDRAIDAGQVRAALSDGVLRLALPKAEALKPRKISVT